MKKIINIFYFAILCIFIPACSDEMDKNDFSGDYKMIITADNSLMVSAMGLDKEYKMKISVPMGFMESEGKRQLFDEILIRKSDDKDYLIFKNGSKEFSWTIVDKDTLSNTERNMTTTLTRI